MPNIFGLDISGIANSAVQSAGGLLDAKLIKVTQGSRTSGSLTAGTNATESTFNGKGVISNYKGSQIDGTIVRSGDRKVLLMSRSFSSNDSVVPETNDKITIENRTYTIVNDIQRDPAGATYICQVRV